LLESWGIESLIVDSSSIEVNRRARRAKTDLLDARKLLSMLVRYKLGERKVWSVVSVPSAAEEDSRHLHRELRTLTKEQTRLINRIKGLLASQGTSIGAGKKSLLERLEGICIWDGSPLPSGLKARLRQEIERYEFVHRQVVDLEAQVRKMLQGSSEATVAGIRRLMGLRAVGRTTATIFVREFGWRRFRNRRQIGALAGLTPTPFQSGDFSREGGISRAGNRHVRGVAVNLAWGWLRLQPGSELSLWYRRRFASGGTRIRKIGIVALARRLLIELWRYLTLGRQPAGALLKSTAV
jgi:transposase